jgi:AsmA protein
VAALAIGGLDVSGATVSYSDAAAGQAFSVKDLAFKTGALSPGQPVDVELGFDLESASPPLSGRVSTNARVNADAALGRVQAEGIVVKADLKGDSLPGGAATLTLAADVSYDGGKHTAQISNLALSALDLSANGGLSMSGLDAEPALQGELRVSPFNLRQILKALAGVEVDTADPGVLGRMALKTGISGTASTVSLEPLELTLDDSTLSGKASVANFAAPAVRFALALDGIDLDRYLPPGQEPAAASPGAASTKAAELPLQTLRGLDVVGSLTAGRLGVAGLSLVDVSAKLDARKGVIKLSPVSARLYDGGYAGNIVLDATGKTPKLSLDESLSKVQIGPLLKDLQGDDPISGTANVKARLGAVGTDPQRILSTLNGQLSFTFLDGALKGVNIAKMIRDAKATLTGRKVAGGSEPNRTDFAEITGTAKVTDGVVNNPDLEAKSPLLRIGGKGTASLPAQSIDYRVTATLVATSKGQGGKELDDLTGIPIPVHITGTFSKPEYALDVQALGEALAKGKAKAIVEEQKAKVEQKVKEKVGESLGDKAGKLLGGDKAGGGLLNNLLKN